MLLLARKIALARVHACRAKRLLPGHDGRVPFSFSPQLLRIGLLVLIPRRVASSCLAEGRAIDARTIEAVGTCGALWSVRTCSALSELRLISREDGGIACSACPASAELLCIRCEVHGDIYFLSRNLLRFAPPVRRFSGVPASPRIPWSLPSLRQPCLQVPPRILEGTAKKRRLSKKFSACLIPGRVPPFFPLVAMVDLLMRMPQRILRSMASITP